MAANQIIHLLIANQSANEAEEIANIFRNAGYPVRDQHVTSAEELEQHLLAEPWDMLLAQSSGPDVDISQLDRLLERCHRRIPVILLSNDLEADRESALLHNFADAVLADQSEWILHACLRELSHGRSLQQQKDLKAELAELKARTDLLMASASDAIAYMADGLHISVNNAYCEIFGYSDDAMDIITVMDLVAEDEHERFKLFLKGYRSNPVQTQSINVTGLRQNGEHVALSMQLSHASFEGEDCTQVMVSAASSAGQAIGNTGDTGMFLKQLKHMVAKARSQHTRGALLCIQPWNFWQTRNNLGLFASGRIFAQLGEFIANATPAECHATRIEGDFFFVGIPFCSEAQAVETAEKLSQAIQDNIFEIDQKTVHCEVRIGIVMFDEDSIESPERLIDYAFTGLGELAQMDTDATVRVYTPPEEEIDIFSADINIDDLTASGKLSLLYQPIISLRGDKSEYYEVKVVIAGDDDEPIDPELLARNLASTNGESPYDHWLLFECIKSLSQQKAKGKPTCLVVPLSGQAVKDKGLANWLLKTMKDSGISADKIIVQLPEKAVTSTLKLANELVTRLAKYKVRACLSDVTDSADAIKTLQLLKTRWIKIDPAMARECQKNKDGEARLKQLISLANGSNTAALVPEVGHASTLSSLWQAGASYIQGAYLQMPSPEMNYEFAEIA